MDSTNTNSETGVVSTNLLAEFDRLLLTHGNSNFDCGAYEFPSGCAINEEYNKLCKCADEAKSKLREMYLAALSANHTIGHTEK